MTDLFIQRDADFSADKSLRFVLRRTFGSGVSGDRVMWIGGNPSDAGADREDPTSRRMNHFTQAWGYIGHVIVNPVPKISSTPEAARKWVSEFLTQGASVVNEAMRRNFEIIRAEARQCALHVACWGNIIDDPDILDMTIAAIGKPLYCLGTNKDGTPRHPLSRGKNRVPDDQRPILWRDT